MAPCWQLCAAGDLEGVRAAIARGEDVNGGDDQNVTGLMWAVCRGHYFVVEVLLQQPSLDMNSINGHGTTAVFYACLNNKVIGLRMLLGDPRLTSVNTRDPEGRTALMIAVLNDRVGCVRELVRVEGLDLETRGNNMSLEKVARWVMCSAIYVTVKQSHLKQITSQD